MVPHRQSSADVVQHHPAGFPPAVHLPFPPLSSRPPPLRDRRFAGADSQGRMDHPKKLLTIKGVNVRLTLPCLIATEPDKKFGGISRGDEAMPERVDRCRMRQVAHICVTLAAQRRWNGRFSTAFWPKISDCIAARAKKPSGTKAQATCTDAARVMHVTTTPRTPDQPPLPATTPTRLPFAPGDSR